MRRQDEADDALFYSEPRFVRHIDDGAIAGLTRWYEAQLPSGRESAILDVCSSWISYGDLTTISPTILSINTLTV